MQLYKADGPCKARDRMKCPFALSLLATLMLTGCATTTITNLTPRQLPRSASGFYTFEAALHSNQQALRKDSVEPRVLIGTESYPMRPALMLSNRWEALIPVPPTNSVVYYRYKFDYVVNRFGSPGGGSKLSDQYQLRISE